MAINISYQPSAAAVGGAAYAGGLGDYQRWLNGLLMQQLQLGTNTNLSMMQMASQRMQAMQQIAAQQQQQASQQQFQMQQMPMQSYLDAQNQAYQSGLQTQRDQSHQLLGAQIGNAASQRDFNEQQQLSAQQAQQQEELAAAREAAQSEGQMQGMQFRSQLQQGQQDMQTWQNPFAQHLQNLQKAQQSGGYTLSDDQQKQVDSIKNDIGQMQQSVANGNGELTMGTVMPQFKQAVAKLNGIVPSKPPPQTIDDAVRKNIALFDPQTGNVSKLPEEGQNGQIPPGMVPVTSDPKTGELQVLRGYRPQTDVGIDPETGQPMMSAKFQGQMIKNQTVAAKERSKYIESRMKLLGPMFGIDPATGMEVPGMRQQAMQQFSGEFDQLVPAAHQARGTDASAMTPAQDAQSQPTNGTPAPQQGAAGSGTQAMPPAQSQPLSQVPSEQLPRMRDQAAGQRVVSPEAVQVGRVIAQPPLHPAQLQQLGIGVSPRDAQDPMAMRLASQAAYLLKSYGLNALNDETLAGHALTEILQVIDKEYPGIDMSNVIQYSEHSGISGNG